MKKTLRASLTALLGIIWVLGFQSPISAQETVFSRVLGSVADKSGAMVSGAKVELFNQGTGVKRSTVTAPNDGSYLFENIVSGLYSVIVEQPGFAKSVRSDIDVAASQTIRVDFALQVGSVGQEITVSGGTPQIETETPTISTQLRNNLMNQSAIAGGAGSYRVSFTFYHITPGASSGIDQGNFNGLPTGFAERTTLDGIRMPEAACCQIVPTAETLEELKVITHGASAEYATPSTVQLTTRQGSNHFHGDVWWLYQDKSLDARDPFFSDKPLLHGHTLGFGVGGPIIKNKMFFFISGEGLRLNNSTTTFNSTSSSNVPTAKMQQGDFSELLDPAFVNQFNSGQTVTVRDPLTGNPFPNNVIPPDKISSVSESLINKFWVLPQRPGLVANSLINAQRPNRRDKIDGRIDYNFSEKHSIFGRYGQSVADFASPSEPLKPEDAENALIKFPGRNWAISDIYTFSPRATNELKVGYSGLPGFSLTDPYQKQDILTEAGMQNNSVLGLPGLSFSDFTGISHSSEGTGRTNDNYSVGDSLSVLMGKHVLKFGVQYNRQRDITDNVLAPPNFTFNGSLSGWSFADFMLGLPSSATRSLASGSSSISQYDWSFFAQDEFRVTPSLTLSLGLRYQIWPYAVEANDKLAVFDPSLVALVVPNEKAKNLVVPTFPTQSIPVLTAAEAHYGARNRALTNTDYGDWAPRVGFAWRPFGLQNTVLRGGFGLYFYNNRSGGPGSGGSVFNGDQTLTQQLGPGGTLSPTIQFPDPFQASSSGPIATLDPTGLSFVAGDPNMKVSYLEDWNLSAERSFWDMGVRVSYLGSSYQRNQFTNNPLGVQYFNPFININEAPPGNLPFDQSRRPIPQVRDVSFVKNGGSANSNALQVVVNRSMKHGLAFNAAYTWNHKITDFESFFGPGEAFGLDRFRSNPTFATPRQQLILTYLWELPFGRGRAFLGNVSPIVDGILGGWKIVGLTKFEAGQYLTPFYIGVNPAGTTPGTDVELPDRIGDGNLSRSKRDSNAPDIPFFDVAAFVCPGGSSIKGSPNLLSQGCPLSTPENVGRFGNSRPNIIQGPGINAWTLSVNKEFRLREATQLQISAQISNLWNHPNWAAPSMDLSSPATVGLITATQTFIVDPWSLPRRRIGLQAKVTF